MKRIFTKITFIAFLSSLLFVGANVFAQTTNINANSLLAHVEVSLSPHSGSFVEGSTFQVPIIINTKSRSINGIEVRINFDKDKLMIVNPTGGVSIIGVWVEPPGFDNTKGTASYVGVVPGGITTNAGLVGTITFKAKALGNALVSINSNSKILLNDGLGTAAQLDPIMANYTIIPKAPEGVQVFSDTHPIQDDWYNNNNVVLSWVKDPEVTGFSYVLDDKPNTIPDNVISADASETTKSFNSLPDGLHYFHIKASKGGVWGTTGNFLVRIDTTPPAEFKPELNFLVGSVVSTDRPILSFSTTDNLSGVDHYEVGIIDKSQSSTQSPVFVQTESPFQVPTSSNGKLQAIVRAIDKAGNVRDESVNITTPFFLTKFLNDHLVFILILIILLGLSMLTIHYLVGHHIIRYIGRIRQALKKEKIEEAQKTIAENKDVPEVPHSPSQ